METDRTTSFPADDNHKAHSPYFYVKVHAVFTAAIIGLVTFLFSTGPSVLAVVGGALLALAAVVAFTWQLLLARQSTRRRIDEYQAANPDVEMYDERTAEARATKKNTETHGP